MRRLAALIGQHVADSLAQSRGTPVRPPSHACPPVWARNFDLGIRPTVDYIVLAPLSAATVVESMRLHPGFYAVVAGVSWTVAFDAPTATGNPYLSTPFSIRLGGIPHEAYSGVTRQLTASLAALQPIQAILVPQNRDQGELLELVLQNNHPTEAVRVTARALGWQFPVAGSHTGIEGGLVSG